MNMDLKAIVLTEGDIVKAHSDFYVCNDECELYEEYGEIIIHPDEDHEIKGELVEDVWSYDSSTKEYKHIYEAPKEILNEEEKEYLEYFLRPFKDKVKSISIYDCGGDMYCLTIDIFNQSEIDLPVFKKDKYYKGMELNKEYTLDELGLFKE